MRVHNEFLKSVGFIGEVAHRDTDGTVSGDLHATGFFASVPSDVTNRLHVYFVTAKHVANDLKGREIYFLVNQIGGGVTTVSPLVNRWYTHPTDRTTDVALVPIGNPGNADLKSVSSRTFGLPSRLAELDVGVGDEVFSIGLFTPAAGSARNEPIVRHGNIALMPQEQIQTELGYADVYLVEARSIGGLSGCPVFVRPSIRFLEESETRARGVQAPSYASALLGLMHGHWDIRESELNKPFITHDRKHGVNLGIGIVVPAFKIFETLYQEELIKMRKELDEARIRASIPGMDSAKTKGEEPERSFTQEDFETALKKATRKTK